jgi:succinyl-CoA synthetase beta subunit
MQVQVGSPQGGMDIEEVAEKTPHLIFKVGSRWVRETCSTVVVQDKIDITKGVTDEQALKMAGNLGFKGPLTAMVDMPVCVGAADVL